MKCIGFVGKVDKTELVGYVSKIISTMGKKVMMVDATTIQKARYTIPTLDNYENNSQYVVQHDGVEIAVGFGNMLELKKYLLSKGEDFNEYDYIVVDTDQEEMIEEYDLQNANELFFMSSYDKLYIHKGVDLLKFLCALKRKTDPEATLSITKILYYSDVNTADSKYIERISENLPIEWKGQSIDFPYDQGDLSVNIRNQYANKFDIRMLTNSYKAALIDTVHLITEEQEGVLKKVLKNVEKSAKFSL